MKMKKLILFLAIATSMVAYGRNDSISNSFTSDFNMFVRLLEETHPDPYTGFGSKMNFRHQVQTLRSGMEQVTDSDQFKEILTSFIAQLEDRKAQYLIIDLRNNSGGMTSLCLPVLYMLYGDDYLNYHSDAQYNRLISPLLLNKWNLNSIEDYNKERSANDVMGDYIFGEFFAYYI